MKYHDDELRAKHVCAKRASLHKISDDTFEWEQDCWESKREREKQKAWNVREARFSPNIFRLKSIIVERLEFFFGETILMGAYIKKCLKNVWRMSEESGKKSIKYFSMKRLPTEKWEVKWEVEAKLYVK